MRRFVYFFIPILLGLLSGPLQAQDLPTRRIEDDSSLRRSLEQAWFIESPSRVLGRMPEIHTLSGGSRVQVRVETSANNQEEFAIVLAREQNGTFPSWSQGSWALVRRRDNDPRGSRIQYFPRSDFNTYIVFRPGLYETSVMDLVLYEGYIIRSLPIPLPFERLMVLPIEEILALTGDRFPRHYFEVQPGAYRDSRAFVSALRARLPELRFGDDGAIDEDGNYVYIHTLAAQDLGAQGGQGGLNCSGFAKWVVDGILRPITGKRLPIGPLKAPFGNRGSSYTEAWEELRDPYFGLDWIRNLASQAGMLLRSPVFGTLEEIEVNRVPLSHVIHRHSGGSSVQPFTGHLQNAGFNFDGLHSILYTLAIDEPGRIYLAAVSGEFRDQITADNPRGLPRLRQYHHVAVLVPYFSEGGVFQIAVFESAAETSFSAFRNRYPGQQVALVRIPIEAAFDP
ncbi:MAG: hypothetical protein FWH12_07815 [Treponema sp.]|nr:hypothetical protein [Treponema sp.]